MTCCVRYCNTNPQGLAETAKTTNSVPNTSVQVKPAVSVYAVQKGQLLEWRKRITTKDGKAFEETDRICASHFTEDSFDVKIIFVNAKNIIMPPHKIKLLKPNAVPTIFPLGPSMEGIPCRKRKMAITKTYCPIRKKPTIVGISVDEPVTLKAMEATLSQSIKLEVPEEKTSVANKDSNILLQSSHNVASKSSSTSTASLAPVKTTPLTYDDVLQCAKDNLIIMPNGHWKCFISDMFQIVSISQFQVDRNAQPVGLFTLQYSNMAPPVVLVGKQVPKSGPCADIKFANIAELNKFLRDISENYKLCAGTDKDPNSAITHAEECHMVYPDDSKRKAFLKVFKSEYCDKLHSQLRWQSYKDARQIEQTKEDAQNYATVRKSMVNLALMHEKLLKRVAELESELNAEYE